MPISVSSKTAVISKIDFIEFELDNGLHVILHTDNSNPLVAVDVWYHVGSKNELKGKTGFAHLFEHMMFQGSKHVKRAEHFKFIHDAGGWLNGSTSHDRTNYYELLPANNMELALWLESDRMGFLNVNSENFENQREVVKEEKKQGVDNVPYGTKWANLFKHSFRNEPYEWVPIGSTEDLNNATLEDAIKFYEQYYTPSNAVLTIAGDINIPSAKETVQKYFGGLPLKQKQFGTYNEIRFGFGEFKEKIYDSVKVPALFIAYKIPGLTSEEIPALEILSTILGYSKSSKLYSNIVYKRKLAKSAGSFVWDNELGSLLVISCMGFVNSNTYEIEKAVTSTIENVLATGITEFELEKAKNHLESQITKNMQTNLGKAESLTYYRTYFKNTELINSIFEKYSNVSAEDILTASSKYLDNNNRVVLHYLSRNGK